MFAAVEARFLKCGFLAEYSTTPSTSPAYFFTAGFAHALNGIWDGLTSAGATLTVALYVYAKENGEFEVAFAIAAILMILTVLINLAATLVGKYFKKKKNI